MKFKVENVEIWATVDEPNFVVLEVKLGAAVFSTSLPALAADELGIALRSAARRARKPLVAKARARVARILKRARR